jgi:hypothetical protein
MANQHAPKRSERKDVKPILLPPAILAAARAELAQQLIEPARGRSKRGGKNIHVARSGERDA